MFRRVVGASVFLLASVSVATAEPLAFQVTFDKSVSAEPFTGRVYVLLSKQPIRQVLSGPNWFRPDPFFAKDVKDWKPGAPLVFGDEAISLPAPLSKLPKEAFFVQAVMDLDRGGRSFSASEGNGYSKAEKKDLDPAAGGTVKLVIDQVFHDRKFEATDRIKLVDIESKLLTAFHKKPIRLRAGVVLPESHAKDKDKRYPVIYEIPGFGGNHFMAFLCRNATNVAGVEMLQVLLDPDCRLGHHVFADSANNGPYGQALVEELIPHIEKSFRGLGQPTARFVTGHSSGGWSSLWLQVTYPDFFGGVWSTAPDPVDFRDFQKIHIYRAGANMFTDAAGQQRPIARAQGKPILFYQPFSDMEVVMGRGGQLFSFEAVFSPRGPGGQPLPLWDRQTGVIDASVARAWERYDIRLVLERNWKALAPKLAGKLYVYMGSEDTFYLEGATILLKATLAKLGSDAVVEIFPGKDHGSLLDKNLRDRINKEMADQFRKHHPEGK